MDGQPYFLQRLEGDTMKNELCSNGHPCTKENTTQRTSTTGKKYGVCLLCVRESSRKCQARKRANSVQYGPKIEGDYEEHELVPKIVQPPRFCRKCGKQNEPYLYFNCYACTYHGSTEQGFADKNFDPISYIGG